MGLLANCKLVPIFIFHVIYTWNGAGSQECMPFLGNSPWCTIGLRMGEFTCLKDGVISVDQKVSLRGRNFGAFTVYCEANYPIDFDMTGTNMQENLVTSFKSSRIYHEKNLIANYEIYISLINLLAPRHFMIYEIGNKSRNTSFFLLRTGEIIFTNRNEEKVVVKSDSKILTIPCIVSDLNFVQENLQLRKLVNEDVSEVNEMVTEKPIDLSTGRKSVQVKRKKILSTRIENEYYIDNMGLSYDITKGILLNTSYFDEPHGDFSCVYKTSKIDTVTKKPKQERFSVKILPPQDMVIEPNMSQLYFFQRGRIHLSCKSKHDIILQGYFNGKKVFVNSSRNEFSHLEYETEFIINNTRSGDKGKISCYSKTNPKRILHSWIISTLDIRNNTKLSLKIDKSKVYCSSTEMKPKISWISCSGETNCRHRVDCLLHGKNCANIHFGDECGPRRDCLDFLAEEPSPQGLIGCSVGEIKYWTYFVKGFDNEIYTDWRTAPPEALIEIGIPNERLYSGGWFPFTCRVSTFLSNGEMVWKYKEADSSHLYTFNRKKSKPINKASSGIKNSLNLHSDITHITCSVPQWDSNVLWNVSRRIHVEAMEIPKINLKEQHVIFVVNQTDRHIGCPANGLPQPKIVWLKDGKKLLTAFQEIETNDEDSTKLLKFPRITREHAGVYLCLATNKAGNATKNFTVAVKDPQKPIFTNETVHYTVDTGDVHQYLLLECKVEGFPRPTIQWKSSENNPSISPIYSEDNVYAISSVQLLISREIVGTYICYAFNEYGSSSQTHIVMLKE